MGTPYYDAVVEEIEDERCLTISLQLFDTDHYDLFGTDRVFGWKLLSFWLAREDPDDWHAEAARHVKSVEWWEERGNFFPEGSNFVRAKRCSSDPQPTIHYRIEVYDPQTIAGLAVLEHAELTVSVDAGPPLENDDSQPAPVAPPPDGQWVELVHADGRTWAVQTTARGIRLRLRSEPTEDPVLRERLSSQPQLEADKLIDEQLAEGWQRA